MDMEIYRGVHGDSSFAQFLDTHDDLMHTPSFVSTSLSLDVAHHFSQLAPSSQQEHDSEEEDDPWENPMGGRWGAFSSSSSTGSLSWIVTYEIPKGTPCIYLNQHDDSRMSDEFEVVLPANSTCRRTQSRFDRETNTEYVTLEVTEVRQFDGTPVFVSPKEHLRRQREERAARARVGAPALPLVPPPPHYGGRHRHRPDEETKARQWGPHPWGRGHGWGHLPHALCSRTQHFLR